MRLREMIADASTGHLLTRCIPTYLSKPVPYPRFISRLFDSEHRYLLPREHTAAELDISDVR